MKALRTTLALLAIAAGALGGAAADLDANGTRQCYRQWAEPLDSCSACMNSCLGAGYMCCTILPG